MVVRKANELQELVNSNLSTNLFGSIYAPKFKYIFYLKSDFETTISQFHIKMIARESKIIHPTFNYTLVFELHLILPMYFIMKELYLS